jgi:Tol biopolymer transport system component
VRIVPASVQYSPDGNRIAYIRHGAEPQKDELWIVAVDEVPPRDTPLAVGELEHRFAFRPDGRALAIARRTPGESEPRVEIIDATKGSRLAELGHGVIGHAAWRPNGESLALVSSEGGAESAGPRRQITNVEHGVTGAAAVSPDGQWVACIAADADRPTLVVTPWQSSPPKLPAQTASSGAVETDHA